MLIDSYAHNVKFYFSKGNAAFIDPPEVTDELDVACISSNQFTFNDFNGDGNADILYSRSIYEQKVLLLVHSYDTTELITSITNGLGKRNKITYSPLTTSDQGIYQKYFTTYSTTNAMVSDFQGSLSIVNNTDDDNGYGSYLSKVYSYEGAHIQRLNKEFLGFSKITTSDIATNTKITNSYNYIVTLDGNPNTTSFYYPHLEKSETFFNDQKIGQVDNSFKTCQFFPQAPLYSPQTKVIFPYLVLSNSQSWEAPNCTFIKTNRKTIEYSAEDLAYGNPTKVTTLNDSQQIDISESDDQFTFKEEANITYFPFDETNWIIGAVDSTTTVTSIKDHGSQTKRRTFTYYPFNDFRFPLIKDDITEPRDPLSLITEFDYYPDGNIKSKTLSAPNADPPIVNRKTIYDYDPIYQSRFITKITDPLDHFCTTTYNPVTGDPTLKKDVNNLISKHSRNVFGTYVQSEAPDGVKNLTVSRWFTPDLSEAPPRTSFYTWEQTSGSGEIYSYFDRLGRILRKVTKGFGNNSIFVDQEYDAYGRPTRTSDPYFPGDSPLFTEKNYTSTLPRVDYLTLPDQTHLYYEYDGLSTTTTNESGQATTQKKNAIGLIDESMDANSQTLKFEYAYNGNELITTSKIVGFEATQTVIYIDKFGNRVKIIDPSSGTIDESYNAFGELISRKDQKLTEQTKTRYTYDNVGRMVTRNEGGNLTTWVFDTKPFGIGEIDSVTNNNNSVAYFYDNLGRVNQKTESISGENTVFSYKYNYDSYSRLRDLTYPSGIIIQNQYNGNGYLSKIMEIDKTPELLWKTLLLNAKDQLMEVSVGNIITTNYDYYPGTGNLNFIHSVANGNILQDLEYEWDNIGNLHSRKKWIDRSQSYFLEEVFGYDILNRLETVDQNNQGTTSFVYDYLGNLTQKPPLTNMIYGSQQNPSPFAITSANFTDNEIPSNTQDITYTVFDKITTITEGTSNLALTYGTDHERIKQVITKDGVVNSNKLYIGGLCEKITDDQGTRFINFINGPKGLFAIITKHSDGLVERNFILNDNLGSINCITDNTGQLLEELSFDPWGKRRNPSDWTYNNLPLTYLFDRGFTGHEHIDLFGLINMNGRAYDPMVGKFLSTDDFVQVPDFTQNFNRYSYCLNNPTTYIDPDGEIFWVVVGVAVIYAAINVAQNWKVISHAKGWNAVGAFAGFAIAGAANGVLTAVGSAWGGPVIGAGLQNGLNSLLWGDNLGAAVGNTVKGAITSSIGYGVGSGMGSLVNTGFNSIGISNKYVTTISEKIINGASSSIVANTLSNYWVSGKNWDQSLREACDWKVLALEVGANSLMGYAKVKSKSNHIKVNEVTPNNPMKNGFNLGRTRESLPLYGPLQPNLLPLPSSPHLFLPLPSTPRLMLPAHIIPNYN